MPNAPLCGPVRRSRSVNEIRQARSRRCPRTGSPHPVTPDEAQSAKVLVLGDEHAVLRERMVKQLPAPWSAAPMQP